MYIYFISYCCGNTTRFFDNTIIETNSPINTIERIRRIEEEIKEGKRYIENVKILNIVLLKNSI